MKKLTVHLFLIIVVGTLAFYIGFQRGHVRGCDEQQRRDDWILMEGGFNFYKGVTPTSCNSDFQEAFKRLSDLSYVDGRAVSFGGTRGKFHRLFEPIYEYGETNDFETMAVHTNPIVRTMGLLCLKYRSPTLAHGLSDKYCYDGERVGLFAGGCSGSDVPFRKIARDILENMDFLGTLDLSRVIDQRRRSKEQPKGEQGHAPS